jgi:hypothetical protein
VSRLHTSFVLGFHGCDRSVGEQALTGSLDLIRSDRDYDWLGPGIYFWEGDPIRAMEWAEAKAARKPGTTPYVIGAVIDLGNCLDLTTREDIELLRDAYDGLEASLAAEGRQLPSNRDVASDARKDKLLRNLDCAVIRYLSDNIEQQIATKSGDGSLEPFDTVRGLFREGAPIYPNSGFYERTHTQIAVRSIACIKGKRPVSTV